MSGVQIEEARPAHAEVLAAIHGDCFAQGWSAMEFDRLTAEDTTSGLLALLPGSPPQPAGFVISKVVLEEADMLTLAVAPGQRRLGVARRLLEAHHRALAARGARVLHLEVAEDNAPARALYAALGYDEVGRRPAYYGGSGAALRLARPLP